MAESISPTSRLLLYPLAIIVAIGIGVVVGAVTANGRGESFGGDYPAFYGAGMIAAAGDWNHLYELETQIEVQSSLPSDDDRPSARFFAYPPQVALLYRPLAAMGYLPSYLVHTLLMASLLVAAIWLARPMIPWMERHLPLAVAAALVFWPMFRSITGGSNTALTMFLIVLGWRFVHDDHEVWAGVIFAMLFYKPQFAVPLVGLFLLRRNWPVVAGAMIGGLSFYLTGALLQGWGWVTGWLDVATDFAKLDAEINGHSAISLVGFTENLFGVGISVPVALAWALVVVCIGFLAWMWWRDHQVDLDGLMASTMPGLLLISPHAMSHDGALVVLTAAIAASRWRLDRLLPWAVVVWLLGASQLGIKSFGFSPGFVMLLVVLAWGWLLVSQDHRRVSVDSAP